MSIKKLSEADATWPSDQSMLKKTQCADSITAKRRLTPRARIGRNSRRRFAYTY